MNISGDASSANGTAIGTFATFTDPTNDYRMGTHEITNGQWDKFTNLYGTPTGSPASAYDSSAHFTGTNIPTNVVSWYETAQFVNYLNTSTGYQAAYKFTDTDYAFVPWDVSDSGYDSTNPFRNSDAHYFLPTENEWVKAAYWNGTNLQTYATTDDSIPMAGIDTNYDLAVGEPWNIGSGSEELNGTYDMMGNVWEWLESPHSPGDYLPNSYRGGSLRDVTITSSSRNSDYPYDDYNIFIGFRVASIPEPTTLLLLGLGGLMLRKRRSGLLRRT